MDEKTDDAEVMATILAGARIGEPARCAVGGIEHLVELVIP